ncbi:hypothetical protein PICST_34764 [Scheffersomyces stipitis CBS 6054]|uniref:Uncharacterized protein n=1 Tax=Scheffersomyces stipitis (strain ATCC 58785 / CBS 6054 / NBRC 10063 / NRRL Y-11545) TaxID=322104 RepID=A3LMT7_PICST|nr:hypothetical protein PICST_34764 [Scheffersomyces stipitis CBS 6054]ABN64210.2 hypothetical protein PICST_34764 [Scheffersomyces stipitis CBS 6054]
MSTSRDTPKLANYVLNTLSKLIESDTEISTIDLNLLENLNTNQSLNYIKLEQNLNVLDKNAHKLEQLQTEFSCYRQILDDIETKITKIDKIAKELDLWSKELEEKVKTKK